MQAGLLVRVEFFPHSSGVFDWIASAWTQLLNSSFKASFTRRWRFINGRPSNCELTTSTRKCDSEPEGTACMWLSLWTCKYSGWSALVSLVLIAFSTGRLKSGSYVVWSGPEGELRLDGWRQEEHSQGHGAASDVVAGNYLWKQMGRNADYVLFNCIKKNKGYISIVWIQIILQMKDKTYYPTPRVWLVLNIKYYI